MDDFLLSRDSTTSDGTYSRGHGLTISQVILITVVISVVAARCYTRLKITGSFGLDDVLIIASLLPGLGLMCCTITTDTLFGWNRHVWDTPVEDLHSGLKLEFAAALLYMWSSALTKMSVVFFCRRLLSPSHPDWYRPGLMVFTIFTLFGYVVYTLVFCFSCQPLSGYWEHYPQGRYDEADAGYKCIDISKLWLSGSILNGVWDVLTWLVPLPIVYQLRLPMKQRGAVMALFGVGICIIVASIAKTIYIYQAFVVTTDVTWIGFPTWVCGSLEVVLGIVCASAPALRPFFSHFFPRPQNIFGGRQSYGRQSYAQISRGRDLPSPPPRGDSPTIGIPLSPIAPVQPRRGSNASIDDMKPWAYNNSRTSSRATTRCGSLNKLETAGLSNSQPSSLNNTPATLTPGTPASKRLAPVQEFEVQSGIFDEDFKINQTAALPPPSEYEEDEDDYDGRRSKSPLSSPDRVANPSWWRSHSRSGTASSLQKNAFGHLDREQERKGSFSTVASGRSRKNSLSAAAANLERNGSVRSDKSSTTKPVTPKLNINTNFAAQPFVKSPHSYDIPPNSALSTTSPSARQHSRKASQPHEFESFKFRDESPPECAIAAEGPTLSDLPQPPPSYQQFVENNSWIRDDRTMGRRSVEGPGQGPAHAM